MAEEKEKVAERKISNQPDFAAMRVAGISDPKERAEAQAKLDARRLGVAPAPKAAVEAKAEAPVEADVVNAPAPEAESEKENVSASASASKGKEASPKK